MKSYKLVFLICCLTTCGAIPRLMGQEKIAAEMSLSAADKTMAKLSQLIGGTWVNANPKFVVEFRYEWAFDGKAIRGLGVLDKGGPHEQRGEVILGLDTVNKTVYYLDCHGGNCVYKGTVKLDGKDLVFDFATIVGMPANGARSFGSPIRMRCNSRSSAKRKGNQFQSSNRRPST